MVQRSLSAMSVLALCWLMALAQDQKPVQGKDSAKVSAGISKEQLTLEDRLSAIISEADQALKNGRTVDAVKQYEAALDMVHKEPLLAEQEQRILRKVGNGYMQANRANDAVPVFVKLVEAEKKDCDSESTAVSTCADAQQSLAVAKMHAGDFEGGLTTLRQAEANYAKAEKLSDFHEFTMIQIMEQAKTKVLVAVALFRLGKTADAVITVEAAIPQLTRVREDSGINIGIRDSAASSIEEAQRLLSRLKSAQ